MKTPSESEDPEITATLHAFDPLYAERYLERLQVEQKHRHLLERHDIWLSWAGILSGLLVTMSFLLTSFLLITDGHEISGTIIATVDLVALAALFITRRR